MFPGDQKTNLKSVAGGGIPLPRNQSFCFVQGILQPLSGKGSERKAQVPTTVLPQDLLHSKYLRQPGLLPTSCTGEAPQSQVE